MTGRSSLFLDFLAVRLTVSVTSASSIGGSDCFGALGVFFTGDTDLVARLSAGVSSSLSSGLGVRVLLRVLLGVLVVDGGGKKSSSRSTVLEVPPRSAFVIPLLLRFAFASPLRYLARCGTTPFSKSSTNCDFFAVDG
jgi:hypothetical protein